jgi:hypothetical protein
MPEHKTSKGHPVEHRHEDPDLHAADQEIARDFMAKLFPQAEVVNPATLKYNCHGFAFAPTHHGWYDFADLFISDDYAGTPMDSPEPGDILIYGLEGVLAHSAVVIEVSGDKIVRVQSKWGGVAEVKHPTDHVPDVYGKPLVLLRTQPGIPKHPVVSAGVNKAVASASEEAGEGSEVAAVTGGERAAGTETAAFAAERTGGDSKAPERFRLMLASTPEVRRRILRSSSLPKVLGAGPFDAPLNAESLEVGFPGAELESVSPDKAQSEIEKALDELSAPVSQFHLLLASTPEVLTSAASRLPPVKDLIRIGKTDPQAKRAVLEFFNKPEIQEDDQITGLVLFLLSQLPSKEAVGAIARYLEAGRFSPFNGRLAVDALREAVAVATA